jgi:carbonic anhydrase/acetyltransferase-like protein (isoleucine patch superfamily)
MYDSRCLGCTLEAGSVVGKACQVMDGAKIGKNGALAPGSLLSMGKGRWFMC